MIHICSIILGASLAATGAQAATFRAVAEEHTVTIYGKSDVEQQCSASVQFSYFENNARKMASNACNNFNLPAGAEVVMCKAENARIIAPKIEGDVRGTCNPPAPEKSK